MEYKFNDNELVYMVNENSDDYKNIIINKYKPIIYSISSSYNFCKYGIDLDDLVIEGMIGLNRAINSFNYNDSSFYTYAVICIKRRIVSYIRECSSNRYRFLNECIYDEDIYNYSSSYDDNLMSEYKFVSLKNRFNGIDSLVFELRFNFFSNLEICTLLDESLNRVNKSICKIKLNLKKASEKLY